MSAKKNKPGASEDVTVDQRGKQPEKGEVKMGKKANKKSDAPEEPRLKVPKA